MSYPERIASQLQLRPLPVNAAVDLLDSGNTIPFIARYRQEATGSLDEEQLRQIQELLGKLRALDERRQTIVTTINEQGKLTPELRQQLLAAATLTELEDLYQPYKPKRKTRASMAREKGLEPLAQLILQQLQTRQTVEEIAAPFVTEEVPTIEEALAGARDIVAEMISDQAQIRQRVREKARQWGLLRAEKIEEAADERAVYQLYYDFQMRVERVRPHQILAINRGEAEKVLRVHVDVAEKDWLLSMRSVVRPDARSPLSGQLQDAMNDAAQRLLLPAIERDVRRAFSETAETHAIAVFAENLRNLLRQPPLIGHTVLALDPGFRTGCKVAVVDVTGKVLETGVIYPHPPQNRREESLKQLALWVKRHHVTLIAIGNGTASRETEQLAAELTRSLDFLHYLIVDEAGASVYSASKLAKAELPDLDVTLRGAVSIARRVQDPLAELVKIDPKSIGVGLYQHDVNQKQLSEALTGVVETVVNRVGVDVNTASPALLTYVSGIGPKLAEKIVAQREKHGRFPNRQALLAVNGLGSKAFEQCAGFLRIRDGDNPLDASAIHPESYEVATAVLRAAGVPLTAPPAEREPALAALRQKYFLSQLAAELNTGVPTLTDIFDQLARPGRDPREDLPLPMLRSDVLSMTDLLPGMRLNGTVRNVVDFGAFIDIGVKQDGLLHRSQMPRNAQVGVGDVVEVTILKVDVERKRIGLGWPD
ncbi:MAG: RNA-binding transcriptional accessory protein [Anaerolinea sp.]|nr:RNA-binding transcriptional accessory protein [Anaerolinea sp.]